LGEERLWNEALECGVWEGYYWDMSGVRIQNDRSGYIRLYLKEGVLFVG